MKLSGNVPQSMEGGELVATYVRSYDRNGCTIPS